MQKLPWADPERWRTCDGQEPSAALQHEEAAAGRWRLQVFCQHERPLLRAHRQDAVGHLAAPRAQVVGAAVGIHREICIGNVGLARPQDRATGDAARGGARVSARMQTL